MHKGKKFWIGVLIGVLVLLGVAAAIRVLTPEDTWVCKNGYWQRHGVPNVPIPGNTCSK